jgi:hypothetical protein
VGDSALGNHDRTFSAEALPIVSYSSRKLVMSPARIPLHSSSGDKITVSFDLLSDENIEQGIHQGGLSGGINLSDALYVSFSRHCKASYQPVCATRFETSSSGEFSRTNLFIRP